MSKTDSDTYKRYLDFHAQNFEIRSRANLLREALKSGEKEYLSLGQTAELESIQHAAEAGLHERDDPALALHFFNVKAVETRLKQTKLSIKQVRNIVMLLLEEKPIRKTLNESSVSSGEMLEIMNVVASYFHAYRDDAKAIHLQLNGKG